MDIEAYRNLPIGIKVILKKEFSPTKIEQIATIIGRHKNQTILLLVDKGWIINSNHILFFNIADRYIEMYDRNINGGWVAYPQHIELINKDRNSPSLIDL